MALIYHNKNEEQQIRKLDENSGFTFYGISDHYVIFMEDDLEGKDIKDTIGIKRLYIYDTNSKKLTKAAETKLAKTKDNIQTVATDLVDIVRIAGKKVFFCRTNYEGSGNHTFYMYDIESKSTQKIYNEDTKDNEIIFFDVDMDKGYLVFEEEGEMPSTLYLLNLKNNKKRQLVKSEHSFPIKMDYPNIAFSLIDTIHVYNIEKNDDDVCIKCDCMPQNINFKDKKLFFDARKTFCYSFNSKKMYSVEYRKNVGDYTYSSLDDKILYWFDEKIHYINIDDIK